MKKLYLYIIDDICGELLLITVISDFFGFNINILFYGGVKMKKMLKRILSVVLSILMICTTVPLFAFANEEIASDDDVSFSSGVGLNGIINALSVAEDNEDYSITDLEIEAKTATVTLTNKDECTLVVAIYDENSGQLLSTGIEVLTANIGVAEVTLDITVMPKKYLAKAFLLDRGFAPLCKEYIDYSHTNAYLEFLEKEPEDFNDEEVIIFDETEEQTDFAVLTDSVTVSEKSNGMTFSYDETTKTYTFKNATAEVRNLSVGDVYYWEYGEKSYEFLLFKVKSISKTGSTVKIVEDEGIALSDAFEFVRVDTDGDYSDVEINENELGSAFSVADGVSAQEFDYDESRSFSSTLKLDYTAKENQSGSLSASISGTVGFKLSATIKLVYDIKLFKKDYYEFKAEVKTDIGLEDIKVEGKISLPKSVSKIETTPIPAGPFLLTPIAHLIAELSISVSFTMTHETTTTVTVDSDNGFKKNSDSDSVWENMEVDDELEIKIGLGVEFELSLAKIVSLSLRADWGVKFTGNATTVGAWINKLHDCYACYYGDVDFFVSGTLSLRIKIVEDKWDFKWDAIKLSVDIKLFDFHISLSAKGFSCGKGECKNVWHPVTVTVTGNNEESGLCENISGATVSTSTGKCDADKDGKYDENSIETDKDGNAVLHFPTGEDHKITVSADGYKTTEKSFSVYNQEKYISVLLDSEDDGDNEGDNPNIEIVDGLISFGSYPQTRVTDSSLLSALNAKSKTWISYGYYSGTGDWYDGQMTAKDYMKYADVTHNGNKYRAVTFSSYRPHCTGYTSSSLYTHKDDNGYRTNTVYWFKYEPLKWRVLDSTGLVICETIIDSQAYNNYILHASGEYYGNSSKTYYANNYEKSSIREWLNDDFYNTAFTSSEKNIIKTTTLDNSAYSESYSEYDSVSTNDKVFLLSYDEARNSNYFENSTARQASGTDYAKCQGLHLYSENKCSFWHLRSAGYFSFTSCGVLNDGDVNTGYDPSFTFYGVRPALKINLSSVISQSSAESVVQQSVPTEVAVAAGESISYSFENCVPGNSYILINVANYNNNFTLTEKNLYFIDQITADENGKIKGSFLPKIYSADSTTLIFGNFKPCEVKITNAPTQADYKTSFRLNVQTENGTGDEKITWKSSNEKVLKVDANGNVTATGRGTATITATVDGTDISDSVTVTVKYTWWQWIIIILLFGWIWY